MCNFNASSTAVFEFVFRPQIKKRHVKEQLLGDKIDMCTNFPRNKGFPLFSV